MVVLPRVADAGRRGAAAGHDLGQGGTGRAGGGAAEGDPRHERGGTAKVPTAGEIRARDGKGRR